jgi:hypothetical protein
MRDRLDLLITGTHEIQGDGDGGQLVGVRPAPHYVQLGAHSGMLPCFFGGSSSRFVRSMRSARVTAIRVCDGAMTASM